MYPYRQKISNQVSIQEMLTFRENGMTNTEIAKHLGISYASVLRYIGKGVRKGKSAAPAAPSSHPVSMITVIPEVQPKILPVIKSHVISSLQGCACVYKVDSEKTYIELSDSNGGTLTGFLEYEDIPRIIKQLQTISSSHLENIH